MYYVYILLCEGNSLYTGITPNLKHRMRQHTGQLKGGAKFTALRPPKALAAVWTADDRSAASKLEYALKRLTAAQKRQLVAQPDLLMTFLPKLDGLVFQYVPDLTLESVMK